MTTKGKYPAMSTNGPLLRLALNAGTGYFTAMSFAHFFSVKKPLLFIYWDTPFYAYQDKIISFCAAVYGILFFTAAKHSECVPAAIASMAVTAGGLSLVTTSKDLKSVVGPGHSFLPYWIQTGLIAAYGAALFALYSRKL